jgi:hypothetical protein
MLDYVREKACRRANPRPAGPHAGFCDGFPPATFDAALSNARSTTCGPPGGGRPLATSRSPQARRTCWLLGCDIPYHQRGETRGSFQSLHRKLHGMRAEAGSPYRDGALSTCDGSSRDCWRAPGFSYRLNRPLRREFPAVHAVKKCRPSHGRSRSIPQTPSGHRDP